MPSRLRRDHIRVATSEERSICLVRCRQRDSGDPANCALLRGKVGRASRQQPCWYCRSRLNAWMHPTGLLCYRTGPGGRVILKGMNRLGSRCMHKANASILDHRVLFVIDENHAAVRWQTVPMSVFYLAGEIKWESFGTFVGMQFIQRWPLARCAVP